MAEKENRCWPGYEPTPGKKAGTQGSCKPKAESKSTPSEKDFKAKRRKQLDSQQSASKKKASAAKKTTPAKKKAPAKKAVSSKRKQPAKKATKKSPAVRTRS